MKIATVICYPCDNYLTLIDYAHKCRYLTLRPEQQQQPRTRARHCRTPQSIMMTTDTIGLQSLFRNCRAIRYMETICFFNMGRANMGMENLKSHSKYSAFYGLPNQMIKGISSLIESQAKILKTIHQPT